MSAQPVIGNEHSAIARIQRFVDEYKRFTQREPEVIILFAEDYDALEKQRYWKGKFGSQIYRFVRGPSIEEYR